MENSNKSLKQILSSPKRIIIFLTGALLTLSCFNISTVWLHSIGINICNYSRLIIETVGWLLIIYSTREFTWLVGKKDLKKFVPLSIMIFSIIFIYTICRQIKDVLIISSLGAAGSTSAKIFVFIFALIYQFFYSKISRRVSLSKLCYFAITPIVGYFILFALVFQQNPLFTPSAITIAGLKTQFPLLDRLMVIDLFKLWGETLFYVLSEVWAVTVTIVFFWQVANRCVNNEERSAFYPALMIVSQISSLYTGYISNQLCVTFRGDYAMVVKYSVLIITLLSICLTLTNKYFFDKFSDHLNLQSDIQKDKTSGEVNIISIVKKNPIYLLPAMLTVCYGFSTVFLEQFWKDKMKILTLGNKVQYGILNSGYFIFQSRVAIVLSLFGSFFMKKLNWLTFASLTPALVLFGSFGLFGVFIFPTQMVESVFHASQVAISFTTGFVLVGLFKSLKYASFDTTKEYYISQQTNEARREIKNLEGLFGRVGKSGASVLLYVFVVLSGLGYNHPTVAKGLFSLSIIMSLLWLTSDYFIYKDLQKNNQIKSK